MSLPCASLDTQPGATPGLLLSCRHLSTPLVFGD